MSGVSGENATTSYSASSSGRIAPGAAIVITERLTDLPELPLPSSLYKETARPPTATDVLAYLQALLQKDPAAFLARYGALLQSQELNHFEALRSADFEVNYWLSYYAAQRMAAAEQAANPRRLPARVKNRRLAAMRRLAAQGEYFSDDAMRHRAPLLYYQQIGRFDEEEQQELEQQRREAAAAAAAATEGGMMEEEEEEEEEEGEELGKAEQAASTAMAAGGDLNSVAAEEAGGGLGGRCLAAALQRALVTCVDLREPGGAERGHAATSGRAIPGGCAADTTTSRRLATEAAAAAEGLLYRGSRGVGASRGRGEVHGGDEMEVGGEEALPGCRGAASARTGAVMRGAGGGGGGGSRRQGAAAAAASAGPAAAAAAAAAAARNSSTLLFSEFLMRQDDEAQLVMRRLQEQQEEDEQMSEHESDEEEDRSAESEEDDQDGGGDDMGDGKGGGGAGAAAAPRPRRRARPSAADRAQMRRDFLSEMQSRFLFGQDGEYVDYETIDKDASLDGDWLAEEARDAEEKYFDED